MTNPQTTLDAVCARGPWTVTDSLPGVLTGDEVRACYEAIRDGRDYARAVGSASRSNRRVDRAVQLLRSAGLIEYAGTPKRWRVKA